MRDRVYPSDAFQARALAGFIHAQGWSRVFVVFGQVVLQLPPPSRSLLSTTLLQSNVITLYRVLFACRTFLVKIPSQSFRMPAVS